MKDSHNFPPAVEAEHDPIRRQLFNAVSRRFEDAIDEAHFQPGYFFVTTDYTEDSQALAVFNLAENYDSYRNNEGTVLEIRVPIDDASQEASGLRLLSPLHSERFFIVKQSQGGQSRAYHVTDAAIAPYSRHRRFPYKIPKSYPKRLLSQLEDFVIVPARPRNAIGDMDT